MLTYWLGQLGIALSASWQERQAATKNEPKVMTN
jgi:hypothetical protein